MTRTSHKKNRPFDFKLIELVRPHPVLYHRYWGGLSTYECMKEKNRLWKQIGERMGSGPDFCLSRWNNLRNHFQRELRNCYELCPKKGIIRGSTWPYLEVMRFLESSMRLNRPKLVRLSKRAEQRLLMHEKQEELREKMEANSDENNSNSAHDELLVVDNIDHIDLSVDTTTVPNGSVYVISEMSAGTVTITQQELQQQEDTIKFTDTPISLDELLQERDANLRRMAQLLNEIVGENKVRAERRIMAYLCKCQLRALSDESVDDLTI